MSLAYSPTSPTFPLPLSSISFNIIKCQVYEIKMVLEKKLMSTTDENGEKKDPLYIYTNV